MGTTTIRTFEVTAALDLNNRDGGVPEAMLFIDLPEPSILNGNANQIGPFSPDEVRVLAARLIAQADHVERWANETL
jgi:hypothetical protein